MPLSALTFASLGDTARLCAAYLLEPLTHTPWTAWRDFWMGKVLDDRFLVVYFAPLLPILLLLSKRRLRVGIILTGLTFLAYIFGVFYAGLWLLTCLLLYLLGERFVVECRRTDVLPIGPPLAAITIIGGWYLATMGLHNLTLPAPLNAWLFEHLRWLFPLGTRDLTWEPFFPRLYNTAAENGPAAIFHAVFYNVHNIGTAYLAVRMLQYFSELKRGSIPAANRSLLKFLAYVCYAPALIQGPIERYAEFQAEMDTCHLRRSWQNVPPALARIGWGLAKSLIVTWYFHPLFWDAFGFGHVGTYYAHPEQIEDFRLLYFGVFLQIYGLYLEFSGYCDISAGFARLLGYRQIENFNWPWLAVSMRDFWRRWHISLSAILRDYLYIPLGGNRRHATLNLVITFFLCGVWHKLVLQVGVWGILMGLMVAINQHWAQWMKRLDAQPTGTLPALRRAIRRLGPLPTIASWLLTQHLFVFSLLIFFGGLGGLNVAREIVRRIWQWLL
jgi:D-alanyl-lipoteichoic acid acyltransferase DltB (MBOAT superfamily)